MGKLSRRGILVVAIAVAGIVTHPSAAPAQAAVRLGAQGGLNFVNLGGADAGNTELVTAWQLGAAASVGRGTLSLAPALLLTRKGATQAGQGFSSTLALTYLQVPILARFRFSDAGTSGSLGTHFYLGPAIGLRVGCSVSATSGFQTSSSSCDEAAGDDPDVAQFTSSEFSGIAGFGVDIGSASVSLQYELGLRSIADNLDLKTQTVSAVVRYFWGGARPDRTLTPRLP
ncbi:MAG: porin family protein [Gemmatimonadota bacterium]|nr:porin family protein [Gemmatimonadota bacterium]